MIIVTKNSKTTGEYFAEININNDTHYLNFLKYFDSNKRPISLKIEPGETRIVIDHIKSPVLIIDTPIVSNSYSLYRMT